MTSREPAIAATPTTTTGSLWRNREFNLLWTSQTLSDLGASVSTLALPLLVLALTGSPVQAGLVGTVSAVVRLICRLPAGVLADRVNRRSAMIVCDIVRLLALSGLAAAVWTGRADLAVIIAVAVIDSIGYTVFGTAEHAALRSIVAPAQLPTAVARNEPATTPPGSPVRRWAACCSVSPTRCPSPATH